MRWIVVFSTGATCTVTVGSLSPLSDEQPRVSSMLDSATRPARIRLLRRPVFRSTNSVASSVAFIRLEGSCQSLQVCHSNAVTRLAIIVRVARLGQSILCVHHFEHSRFARLVPHRGQPQAIGSQLGGGCQSLHFRA